MRCAARLLALAVVFAWCVVARADDTGGAAAAAMFERGRVLAEEGNFEEACALFERSYELEPALGTLLNLANCREQLGDFAEAWRLFSKGLRQATREGDDTRVAFATKRIEDLEKRLVTVSLTIPDAAVERVRVLLNGRPLATAPTIAERVNPGEITLELATTGRPSHVQRARARAGETVTFVVPAELVARPRPPAAAPPAPAAEATEIARPSKIWLGTLIGGVGIGVAGVVMLYAGDARVADARRALCIGGGYLGSDRPDMVDGVDCKSPDAERLTQQELDEWNDRGDRGQLMANAGFGVAVLGAGLAAVSAYWYFIRTPSAATRAALIPSASPGYAGRRCTSTGNRRHVRWLR